MTVQRRTLIAVAALGVTRPSSAAPASARVKLRLIATSDLHMFVHGYDYFHDKPDPTVGLARIATLIAHARAEARNTMLFDNGDILQGNPLGDYAAANPPAEDATGEAAIHPMFRAMNTLGYDAATLGNHDFNYGLAFLERALAGATFPFVCANLDRADGTTLVPHWTVLARTVTAEDGTSLPFRVGVIGFVPPQIMVWDRAKLDGHVRVTDIVEAATREAPRLRAHCDLVVALSHSGISSADPVRGEENASLHLASVPGIDVVIAGHSHRVFPGPDYLHRPGVDATAGLLGAVPAVMPGYWGSHLGLVDLEIERDRAGAWSVAASHVETRPIARRDGPTMIAAVEEDAGVLAAVAPEHAATIAWVGKPAGELAYPISTAFALAGDDSGVALVNAAQLWYARGLLAGTPHAALPLLSAAAPFKAGGLSPDWFIDLPAGPIAIRDVADLYGYPNTVAIVRVTGAMLAEWLERSASIFHRIDPTKPGVQELIDRGVPSYNFDVLAGLTYSIDVSVPSRYAPSGAPMREAGRRIGDLRHDGVPVDPAREFVVVTNNYRADGGGRFPGLDGSSVILRGPDGNRDALLQFLAAGVPQALAVRTWRFAPIVTQDAHEILGGFDGPATASARLPPGIRSIGPGLGGFHRYAVTLG